MIVIFLLGMPGVEQESMEVDLQQVSGDDVHSLEVLSVGAFCCFTGGTVVLDKVFNSVLGFTIKFA